MSKTFIKALPLSPAEREDFIKEANAFFEDIFEAMEPRSPEETRKLWDAGHFVDNFIPEEELPVEREFALMMMEQMLVQLVGNLASEADKIAGITSPAKSKEEMDEIFAAIGKHGLRCGIVIENEDGDTHEEILESTAEALRVLATQIETGRLKVGLHPVKTPDGKVIGEIQLEQYETIAGGAANLSRPKKAS
jgi:hypothetical protein